MIEIDTSNILFIAGGAFVGLDAVLKNRVHGSSIGFNSPINSKHEINLSEVTPDDLVKFGMIPEFVGRFPVAVALSALTRDDMIQVLTSVKNNYIQQYQWLFKQDSIEFNLTESAIDTLVDRTMSSGTGARGLHSELERVLMPHMFDLIRYRDRGILQVTIDAEQVNTPTSLTGS
jgi:ATP-dependent Clp protease ATP-binding subunit ClpX